MTRSTSVDLALVALFVALAASGCSRSAPTDPWVGDTNPVVFDGDFRGNGFNPFYLSKSDAVTVDSTQVHDGMPSLKITVMPASANTWSGGAFVAGAPRNLTGYDALSFWVRANRAGVLEKCGFGNDNTGTSKYEASRGGIPVTTAWTRVYIAIPLPERLRFERGLFFFSQAGQESLFTVWINDLRFVRLGSVTNPRPVLATQTVNALVHSNVSLANATRTTFNVNGADQLIMHSPGYFDFSSSDDQVARASGSAIAVLGPGTATITARLGATSATGRVTVNSFAPPAAPSPTLPAANCISLFSDAYTNRPVTTWSPTWDVAEVADVAIEGNPAKVYTNLSWAAIEFPGVDATAMTHFHADVWIPAGTMMRVKLVDFGDNGIYGTDDSESELTFNASSTPAIAPGTWVSLEVPFTSFTGLAARAHLSQIILSGDARTVFVDNLYFHQ